MEAPLGGITCSSAFRVSLWSNDQYGAMRPWTTVSQTLPSSRRREDLLPDDASDYADKVSDVAYAKSYV